MVMSWEPELRVLGARISSECVVKACGMIMMMMFGLVAHAVGWCNAELDRWWYNAVLDRLYRCVYIVTLRSGTGLVWCRQEKKCVER